jgi:type IV secretion system protein VirB4
MSSASPFAREREPDTYVPYVGHRAPGVLLLDDGSKLVMLHLRGIAWETADTEDLNAKHAQRNVMLRNIASDRLVLSSHVVRTMADPGDYPAGECRSGFAAALDAAYRARLLGNRLYRNDLYVSVLLRPSQAAGKRVSRLLNRRRRGDTTRVASQQDMDRLESVVSTLLAELHEYEPRRLGLRENARGVVFSEIGEALRLVLTGERLPVPLVNGHLGGAIYTDRVIVGREAIEIRGPGRSVFAAGFGLREYPASTWPGMFDGILTAPYCCCLTQTFGFLAKQAAQDKMGRKQNQMTVAGDKAATQTEELSAAADLLQSNAFCMGDHHLTLVAFADSLDALADVAARARRDLAESGAVVSREDLALEAVYWAQLPGNLHLRSRPGAITSRNFAAMASYHNFPLGPAEGYWGQPIALLRTTGGTGYRYHFHHREAGNTFITGPIRTGKTVALLFLLSQAEKAGAQVVFFDKDRGGEILARAVGGSYLVLPSGRPSGLAPLKALDGSPENIEFLTRLVKSLIVADGTYELTPDDDRRIAMGLAEIMELPAAERSFSELRAFLGHMDAHGAGVRLEKWCKGRELGWALDCDADDVSLDGHFLGFDMTAVLDNPAVRGPMMAYLFHRVEALIDGRRLVFAIDEFWKALLDPAFQALVHDKLKTLGKRNSPVLLATQSPRDALNSPIAHTIIEQCPNQIHMPNPRADRADYVDGLKLTEAEFLAIKEDLTIGGRRYPAGRKWRSCSFQSFAAGQYLDVQ